MELDNLGRDAAKELAEATGRLGAPAFERVAARRHRAGMASFAALAAVLLIGVAVVAVSLTDGPIEVAQPDLTATTATTLPTDPEATPPPSTPLMPPPGADVVVATQADGFESVAEALASAIQRWESAALETYGYRLRIDCECSDRGMAWVRVFDWPEEVPWDVETLHRRIKAALEGSADRIEVAFDGELGIPLWFAVDGDDSETILVEEFHEITTAATPFDGVWRFVGGTTDGQEFGNPTTGLIIVTLRDGYIGFPIDCNEGSGAVDIHGPHFGIGPVVTTAVGCGMESAEGQLFSEALQGATTIERAGDQLVISGGDSVLRLVPLEQPELRGELPLTAAGETLVIEGDAGVLTSVFTISSGGDAWPGRHPGRSVFYTLTAVNPESNQRPDWSRWEGEFEVPPPPSGPQQIVMPADIGVGDYRLCSPYWSGDFFCYDLLIRPSSAPWYVTAGTDGVVLHDRDGTSKIVWEGEARIAFWFEELLVVETNAGAIVTVRDDGSSIEWAGVDPNLLDAGRIGDSPTALVAQAGKTVLLDANRLDSIDLGPAVPEGRLAGSFVILRPSPDRIEVRSSADGSALWEFDVDPQEMITSVAGNELRLDMGRLNTDSSPVPFWQYLDTRLVDLTTGRIVEEFSFELAIPLEGGQVTEICIRAELRDGLLLCPQPDGRFTQIGVEGGDQLTVAGVADVIASYVR